MLEVCLLFNVLSVVPLLLQETTQSTVINCTGALPSSSNFFSFPGISKPDKRACGVEALLSWIITSAHCHMTYRAVPPSKGQSSPAPWFSCILLSPVSCEVNKCLIKAEALRPISQFCHYPFPLQVPAKGWSPCLGTRNEHTWGRTTHSLLSSAHWNMRKNASFLVQITEVLFYHKLVKVN